MKDKIKVVEIFNSISGEGISAGEVTTFVRLWGCNLRCSYCDTKYSYENEVRETCEMSRIEILEEVERLSCKKVICTGGEPLETDTNKRKIPLYLAQNGYEVRIETNGACMVYSDSELDEYGITNSNRNLFYCLDVKCPDSGMSKYDKVGKNIFRLVSGDELKFVVSNEEDLKYAHYIIQRYQKELASANIVINFSPVFGKIETNEIVEFLKKNNSYFQENNLLARLSLQIHKFIWSSSTRGV